ncbi:hypothetical protein BH23ACT10_BH23ACT10_11240 [soil metagenome]
MADRPRDDARASVFPGFADVTENIAVVVDLLAERRRRQGLSQTEVAARMRTSQSAVARLEANRGDLRLSTLERYARALGHTMQFGVAQVDDPENDR